jgi:hypothetical protein
MDPMTVIGAVISVASYVWEYENRSSHDDQAVNLEELQRLLQAQQAAYIAIAQNMHACALYELRKSELDAIRAAIETVQEILDSTKNAVPPLDASTAGDLTFAENQALLTVHDCNSLQNELQSDVDHQPEASIRELLMAALTAEVDVGLLRYACLIRWETLGVADQADEKVATLNDLLEGCDTALATLRIFTDKLTRFASRRHPDPETHKPLYDYGYVDHGHFVCMAEDLSANAMQNPVFKQVKQEIEDQIARLQQANFLSDPDVQVVQQMEQTIRGQWSRLTVVLAKGPAGSVYQAPNRRRLAAKERWEKAAVSPSQIAPKRTPPVVEKSQSWMSKPLSEIMANPELVPFLGSELSIDAQAEQHPVNEVTFTLTFASGIFDMNAPERNIKVPVFIMDEFGNKPLVQPEYQLSSRGAKVTATVQVPMRMAPETFNASRDIFVVADPLNSIVECKETDSWKKVSVSGIAASRPMQAA